MRALLLVLAVIAACDAGAKPEPAKQPPRGSATAASTGGDLAGCMKDRPELIDELLLAGFDGAIRIGSAAPQLDTSGSGR